MIESLNSYLPMVTFGLSIAGSMSMAIATWVKMGTKMDGLSFRVEKLEEGAEGRDRILSDIRERLVRIETKVEDLKK